MKASELIGMLKRKIEDHGDWEVVAFIDKGRHYDEELEEWFEDESKKSIDDVETITADGGQVRLFLLKWKDEIMKTWTDQTGKKWGIVEGGSPLCGECAFVGKFPSGDTLPNCKLVGEACLPKIHGGEHVNGHHYVELKEEDHE